MARCITLRLLLTVRRLHAAGILHLDLKLENVAVDENFGVRILDFGLARYVDDVPGIILNCEREFPESSTTFHRISRGCLHFV